MRASPTTFSDSTGLRLCGIAEEPFCPCGEKLLRLQNLGALQVADFGRQPLDRGGDDAERGEIHGMAVARNDLGRDRLDRQTHLLGDMGFDARIDLRKGADRAGDRAGRNFLARRDEALFGAGKFGIGDGELEPERGRLGVDAVRAADGRRQLVFARAALQRGVKRVDIRNQKIGGADELNVEAGVEHVGRRHALVHEARFRTHDLGEMSEESDDVVLDLAFDLLDARDVEFRRLAFFPNLLCCRFRDHAELGHRVGCMRLDFEPDAKARLRRPDRRHLRAGVARNGHAASPRASAAALRIAAILAR